MKSKRQLIIILLLGSVLHSIAVNDVKNKGNIHGVVKAKSNRLPIEYAHVALYAVADSTLITGTTTDSKGQFMMNNIGFGHYYLTVGFIGFNNKTIKEIDISSAQRTFHCDTIILEETFIDLKEVQIKSEIDVVQYQIDKKVIHASEKPEASGGSAVNLLENTPSIQVDMEGNVSLRGSQNFTVLVDGKPSALNGNNLLKQIPAAMVENIEIITNPSAKYDAQGTTGIINIILKKNIEKNTNGIINVSIGTYNKYTGDFSINHQIKKVNLFMNANYGLNYSYPFMSSERKVSYNDSLRTTIQEAKRKQYVNPYSVGAGLDWNINDYNQFTLQYDWGHWGYDLSIPEFTKETLNNNDTTHYAKTQTFMKTGGFYHSGSVFYKHNFKEKQHELSSSFTVSSWKGGDSTDVNEMFTNNTYNQIYNASRHMSMSHDASLAFQLKVDYTKTFKEKHKIETGYQGYYKTLTSDYGIKFQDYLSQSWYPSDMNKKEMDFTQNIQAFYFTYSGDLKGFQYQIGLRGEFLDRHLQVPATAETYDLQQFNLFPSLHISKIFPKQHQLQLSYSRRVNRPHEWNLNPFPIYSDTYITQIGNPALLPEFTHSFELNYMKYMKKGFIAVENYYHQTNHSISRTYRIDSNGTLLYGVDNLNKNYSYGISLSGNYYPVKWFSLYANTNFYFNHIEGDIVSENIKTRSFNYDFSLSTTFNPGYHLRFQLTAFYNAPKLTAQGSMHAIYGCHLSISKEFFKQRLQVVLTGRDIFRTVKYNILTDLPGLQSKVIMYSEYPVVILQLSYKINNYKKKQEDTSPLNEYKNRSII